MIRQQPTGISKMTWTIIYSSVEILTRLFQIPRSFELKTFSLELTLQSFAIGRAISNSS